MARGKDGTTKMGDFTCPDCGKTYLLPVNANRRRCVACASERNRKARREHYRRLMAEQAIINAAAKAEVQKEREVRDLDLHQCRKCHWWRGGSGGDMCCHYYLLHGIGHRRDPGNGPGDCRSFEPKRKRSKQEVADENRRLLEIIEADYSGQQAQKGER